MRQARPGFCLLAALLAACAAGVPDPSPTAPEADRPPTRRSRLQLPSTPHEVTLDVPGLGPEALSAGLRASRVLRRGSPAATLIRTGRVRLFIDPDEPGARPDLQPLPSLFGTRTELEVRPLPPPAPPSAAIAFGLDRAPPIEASARIRGALERARRVSGMHRVDLVGDLEAEVLVRADADALADSRTSLELIAGALRHILEQRADPEWTAPTLARELMRWPIVDMEGVPRFGELARIRPRVVPPSGFARFDGRPAVLMLCRADPRSPAREIRAAVGDLAADLAAELRPLAVRTATLDLLPRGGVVPFFAALVLPDGATPDRVMAVAGEAERRLFGLDRLEALSVMLRDRSLLLLGRIGEAQVRELVDRLRAIPDVHVRFAPFRDQTGTKSPLGFGDLLRVRGADAAAVEAVAIQIAAANAALGPPVPALRGAPVVVAVADPERVQAAGFQIGQVRREAALALQGQTFPATPGRPRVVLRLAGDPEPGRVLARVSLTRRDGERVPLAAMTRVEVDVDQAERAYLGAQRVVYFSVEDPRTELDLRASHPGVDIERVPWRSLGRAERSLLAAAALP